MKKTFFSVILFALLQFGQFAVSAQNIGIGTSAPDQSALLDLQSTNKGLLLPRMSSTQRNNIPAPATGLLIFDTDKGVIYMFDGAEWLPLAVSKGELHMQPRTAGTPAPNTGFGWQSSISGNYAVVSSCKATSENVETVVDTVYIYEKINGSWTYRTKLTQSDPAPGDGFGRAVAIAGDYLLVGAPHRNNQAGAVYAFTRSGNNWIQTAILTPTVPVSGSYFGASISIGGVYALIGAPRQSGGGVQRGAVYSFSRNISTWTQTQQLLGISGLEGFGESIDVSGAQALVGAPNSAYNGVNWSGIAYYFKRTGTVWVPEDTIYNSNPEENDKFGYAVAVNESTGWAFISKPGHFGVGANTGQVITYSLGGNLSKWAILTSPTEYQESIPNFGSSLSVYNDYLLIGAPGAFNNDAGKGRVYIYKYDQTYSHPSTRWQPWKMIKDETLLPSGEYYDTFGLSVYINGSDVILGNPGANNFRGKVLFLNIF